MSLAKCRVKASRFSPAELTARAMAMRRANAQLLHVPWRRFRRAYEEYPHWQCLAPWSRAVIATELRIPSTLFRNKSAVRGQAGHVLYVVLRRMLAPDEFPLLGVRDLD